MSPLAWVKLGVALGAVALIAWLGWLVSQWHEAYEKLPKVEAALILEQECGEGSTCVERQQDLQEKADEERLQAVTGLADELAELRARPMRTRTVRVCNDGGVQGAGTAAGTDGGAATAGELHGPAGRDIGPALYALAAEADTVSARCRALQGWNRALAAPSD